MQRGEVTSVQEGHCVERVTDDAGETTSAMAKPPRDIDESASDVIGCDMAVDGVAFQAVLACFYENEMFVKLKWVRVSKGT